MGEILVEKRFITADQLAGALLDQEETGRLLGEICVELYGLDRFALADALGEQWEEIPRGRAYATHRGAARETAAYPGTEELRARLDEAEAARAELAAKTDELARRLTVLETLVARGQ